MDKLKPRPHHHMRKRIIDNDLLSLIDKIPLSERDKDIVISYTNGVSFTELSRKYNISPQRVSVIVADYIKKTNWYRKMYL